MGKIDYTKPDYHVGRVLLYAGGFGTMKEQSRVLAGADTATLEQALRQAQQPANNGFEQERKQRIRARLERLIARHKELGLD